MSRPPFPQCLAANLTLFPDHFINRSGLHHIDFADRLFRGCGASVLG
jgi:hypothetical protein